MAIVDETVLSPPPGICRLGPGARVPGLVVLGRAANGLAERARMWRDGIGRGRGRGGVAEEPLHEFAALLRAAPAESVAWPAMVEGIARMTGARRVELYLAERPGRRPRRVACWPPEFTGPGWRGDAGEPLPSADTAPPATGRRSSPADGPPLCVPLRVEGRDWGLIRVSPSRRRRWPRRLLERLGTIGVLAAVAAERAADRAIGGASATLDPATGAHNLPFLSAYLTHAMARARRGGESLSLLCVGADHLAELRERHGPELADAALRRLVRAANGTLRASDLVARLDDDRFIAVLPGASAVDALQVAESLRRAIGEAAVGSATDPPLTATIGVASCPHHAHEPGPLLAAASEALARARSGSDLRPISAPWPSRPIPPLPAPRQL